MGLLRRLLVGSVCLAPWRPATPAARLRPQCRQCGQRQGAPPRDASSQRRRVGLDRDSPAPASDRFTGRATTPMIRFGHHRRYSPERNWEPLSDTEWAVLAPFLFRAAEAEMQTRREADIRGRPAPRRADPSASAAPPAAPSATPARGSTPSSGSPPTPCPAAHPRPGPPCPRASASPTPSPASSAAGPRPGLWTKLLQALADPDHPGITILRRLESWICRTYRRAWRLLGVGGMALAPMLFS